LTEAGRRRAALGAEPRPDFVQSLERGLEVIRALGTAPALTLTEVSQITDLTRATARRFLLTLTELGYVHCDGRKFSLRPRVLELGYAYLSTLELNEVAFPHMEAISAEFKESSSIAVLDGDDITYVARVPVSRIMTVNVAVGTRFPAYATSMGRVLLAYLPSTELVDYLERVELRSLTSRTIVDKQALRADIRRVNVAGYSIIDQELEDGLRAVAVPIRDISGSVIASLSISTHASRATLDHLRRRVLPRLVDTVGRIESDLGALGSAPAREPVTRTRR
jgi:IclR family transcriptional regulator, pca regulon regulatory protein